MPRNTQPWVLANTGTVTLLHATVPGGSQRIMSAPQLHLRQVAVFRLLVQSGAQHLPAPDSICVVLPLPGEESCTGPPVRLGFLSAFPDAGPTKQMHIHWHDVLAGYALAAPSKLGCCASRPCV